MNKKSWIAIISVAVIALVVVVLPVRKWGGAVTDRIRAQLGERNGVSYGFRPGETWETSLKFHSEGAFALQTGLGGGVQALNATPVPYALDIQDDAFEVSIIARTETGYDIFLRAPNPRISMGVSSKDNVVKPDPWNEGVLLNISNLGEVTSLRFGPDKTPMSDGFFRLVAAALFPRTRAGDVESELPGGRLLSSQQVTQGGPGSLTISSSFKMFTPGSPGLAGKVEGQANVEFLNDAISALSMDRKTLQTSHSQPMGTESLQIKVTLTRVSPTTPARMKFASSLQSQPPATMRGKEEFSNVALDIARKKVAGTTYEGVKSRFDAEVPKRSLADDPELFNLLKSWLLLRPELIPEFAKELESFDPSDPRYDMVGILLAKTDSPQGQKELTSRIDSHLDDVKRIEKLVFSLALVNQPTAETAKDALSWIQKLPADGATYLSILPLAAGVGFHADEQTRAEMAESILDRGLSSQSVAVKVQAANALGNLGYEGTVNKVRSLLTSDDVNHRALGVDAIRRVQGSGAAEATEVMTNMTATDPDNGVRRKAAANLDTRAIPDAQLVVLEQRLTQEKDPTVAVNIAQAIGAGSQDRSRALEILNRFNADCGHPAVCRKVENIILLLSQRP